MKIVISSGHGLYVRGAACFIDEVDEARRVVNEVANCLEVLGVEVEVFHDDTSHSQDENLRTIVTAHNDAAMGAHDLDVSVHFNAYTETAEPMGTECLYVTQAELASDVANAIAKFGMLTNRGAKKRSDLYFLNNTDEPAVLVEVCFVDSAEDTDYYNAHFLRICRAIAVSLCGKLFIKEIQSDITASVFGGEDDYNVSAYDESKVLNDSDLYIALPDRFEGDRPKVVVRNASTGKTATAEIWDVGPWNIDDPYWSKGSRPQAESGTDMTGRKTNGAGIDLSPALAKAIGIDGMGTVHWTFEGTFQNDNVKGNLDPKPTG